MSCSHSVSEVRLRVIANGNPVPYRQCVECGETIGGAIARSKFTEQEFHSLPPFDNALREQYQSGLRQVAAKERESAYAASRATAQAEYQEYLRSPQWLAKREAVLERDNYICQGCRTARATEVHHLTYANRGDELLFQLISLCTSCHERVHRISELA